jgi:hypothetical protein
LIAAFACDPLFDRNRRRHHSADANQLDAPCAHLNDFELQCVCGDVFTL